MSITKFRSITGAAALCGMIATGLAAPTAIAKPITVSGSKCIDKRALDCVVEGNADGPIMDVVFNNPAHNDKQDNVQLVLGYLGVTDTLVGDGSNNGFYKTDAGGNPDFIHDSNGTATLDWTYSGAEILEYATVKAGLFYIVFDLGGASSGSFTTTGYIENNGRGIGISHVSFWLTQTQGGPGGPGGSSVVSAPATAGMLLAGGLGLIWMRRRV